MNIRENLYMMSLVGGLSGLLSWAVRPLLPFFFPTLRNIPQELYWLAESIDLLLMGLFIGTLCIGFADYWADQKVMVRRLFAGAIGGGGAGWLDARLVSTVRDTWLAGQDIWLITILAWALTGALIGLVIGLIRYRFRWRRVFFSLLGGATGAFIGGLTMLALGEKLPYMTHALGLMVAGMGVTFGSTATVVVLRNAQLKLVASSPDVLRFFTGKTQEWDLHRGDRYLFGNDDNPGHTRAGYVSSAYQATQYVHIPDPDIAWQHAEIYEAGGKFYVRPHAFNEGTPYPLLIKSVNEQEMKVVDEPQELKNGDEVLMGKTTLTFTVRGQSHVGTGRYSLTLAAYVLFLVCQQDVYAQSAEPASTVRFAQADKVRLLRYGVGSERPCFRITVNLVDHIGRVLPIPIPDPIQARQGTQVFEGDKLLEVLEVDSTISISEKVVPRIAILLLDVSGSMLQRMGNKRTKFQVMQEAALQFATDFVQGIDHIAVIPFGSYRVISGVNEAIFSHSKQELEAQIRNIPIPSRKANTGLYSAMQAAILRLQSEREKMSKVGEPTPQALLFVMTDGMNDVGNPGDDPDLLQDWQPVRSMAESAGLQILTVGFGDAQHIDVAALRSLAWPTADNYRPAHSLADLNIAFQTARTLLLQRLQITFFPQQKLRGQMVKQHDFKVRFQPVLGDVVEGSFSWHWPGFIPPFEGECKEVSQIQVPETPTGNSTANRGSPTQHWVIIYFCTLGLWGMVLYLLWFKLRAWLWADYHDAEALRQRALAIRSHR